MYRAYPYRRLALAVPYAIIAMTVPYRLSRLATLDSRSRSAYDYLVQPKSWSLQLFNGCGSVISKVATHNTPEMSHFESISIHGSVILAAQETRFRPLMYRLGTSYGLLYSSFHS